MSTQNDLHLSAERMQAFLDGDLPDGDAVSVRAHVEACPRCRSELSAWETLFEDLDDLPALAPSAAFRGRILSALPAEGTVRAGGRRTAGVPQGVHVPAGRLQDHLEGRLAARMAAEVEGHLDSCAVCRAELADFRRVALALDAVPRLAPGAEFGERVMAAWSVEQMARVAMAPTTRWERVAAWARSRAPSSRQGWAAVLGVATAPAVIAALVIQAVFSHPLVTVGSLVAFLRLQVGDLAAALGGRATGALETLGLEPLARAVLDALASPTVAAGAATAASGLTFAALWVVYRFLVASQPADRPYAPISR